MPQVKFLQGKAANLKDVFLDTGSVYFTKDDRRLYVDTFTDRVPVGDYGKIFYVRALRAGNPFDKTYGVGSGNDYKLTNSNFTNAAASGDEIGYMEAAKTTKITLSSIQMAMLDTITVNMPTIYNNHLLFKLMVGNTEVGRYTIEDQNSTATQQGRTIKIQNTNKELSTSTLTLEISYNSTEAIVNSYLCNISQITANYISNWTQVTGTDGQIYYTQKIYRYYDEMTDKTPFPMSNLIGSSSIIFVGAVNPNNYYIDVIPNFNSKEYIEYRYIPRQGTNDMPTEDIWIQCYTPNFIVEYSPLRSVYTTTIEVGKDDWGDDEITYITKLEDIDLTQYPWLIKLAIDATNSDIEELTAYDYLSSVDVTSNGDGTCNLTLQYNDSDIGHNPYHNVGFNIVAFIGHGTESEKNGTHPGGQAVWAKLNLNDYDSNAFNSGAATTIHIGLKESMLDNNLGEEYIYYTPDMSKEEIVKGIQSITASNNGISITFKGTVTAENIKDITLYVINVSDISNMLLNNAILKVTNAVLPNSPYQWTEVEGAAGVYAQELYNIELLGKHIPLIQATSGELSDIRKIFDVKYVNNRLIFFAKERPNMDIGLEIIDFK